MLIYHIGDTSRPHSIINGSIVEHIEDGIDIISLPAGEYWENLESNKLFVRNIYPRFYEDYISSYKKGTKIILSGTPGIGKSSFGLYCIYRGLKDGKSVLYHSTKQLGGVLLFTSTSSRYISYDEFLKLARVDDNILYIADGIKPLVCRTPTILITSPNRDVWFQYSKEPKVEEKKFGIFSLSEMHLLRLYCFDEVVTKEAMMNQIKLFGNIPRTCLTKIGNSSNSLESLSTLIKSQDISMILKSVALDNYGTDNPVHRLIHIKATDDFGDGGRDFASVHVAESLVDHFRNESIDRLERFLGDMDNVSGDPSVKPTLYSSMYQQFFEMMSIRTFATGGEFEVFNLITGEITKMIVEKKCIEKFVNIKEVNAKSLVHYIPKEKGYCAIDSFEYDKKELHLFNSTIDLTHKVMMLNAKQDGGLFAIDKLLNPSNDCKLKFSFLVPKSRFNNFKKLTNSKFEWSQPSINKVSSLNITKSDRTKYQQKWSYTAISIPFGQ
jgi:hypothetical protein